MSGADNIKNIVGKLLESVNEMKALKKEPLKINRKTELIILRISPALKEALRLYALKKDLSISRVIIDVIRGKLQLDPEKYR